MILGRNAALWVALAAAVINAAVVVFGVPLSAEGIAALNGLALTVIGVIANEADPTTLGTFARSITVPIGTSNTTTGTTSVQSGVPSANPTTESSAGSTTSIDPIPQNPTGTSN